MVHLLQPENGQYLLSSVGAQGGEPGRREATVEAGHRVALRTAAPVPVNSTSPAGLALFTPRDQRSHEKQVVVHKVNRKQNKSP